MSSDASSPKCVRWSLNLTLLLMSIFQILRIFDVRGKKQVWCSRVRTRGLSEAKALHWSKYLRIFGALRRHSAPGELCPLSPSLRPCIGWSDFTDFDYKNDSFIKNGLPFHKNWRISWRRAQIFILSLPKLMWRCICYANVTGIKLIRFWEFLEWRSGGQGKVQDNNKGCFTKQADS